MPSISTDVSSLFLYLVVWDYSAQLLDHKSREDRTLMVWKINAYSLKDNDLKVIFLIFHELIPSYHLISLSWKMKSNNFLEIIFLGL